MARTRVIAGISIMLIATACGNDSASGPPIDDLPAMLAKGLCAEVEGCLEASDVRAAFGATGCKGRLEASIADSDFMYTKSAVTAGRIRYDASQVTACLDELKGVGCDFPTTRVFKQGACDKVFTGGVKLGGKCGVDADCAGTAFCKLDSECPGTCTSLLKAGENCTSDDECQNGLECSADASCAAPAKEGEKCGGGVAIDCRAGLSCIGSSSSTGKAGACKTTSKLFVGKLDDTCSLSTGLLCIDGLSCVASIGTNGMASFACKKPSAAGAACQFGVPSPCPDGQYCNADISMNQIDGTCVPLPAAGEDCTALVGSPDCAAGLICDTDQRCHPVNRLGHPCASDASCASGNCVAGSCQRPPECKL